MYTFQNSPMTFKASADVCTCRFVKLDTSDVGSVIQGAAASDVCIGVSGVAEQLQPSIGGTTNVHALSGYSCQVYSVGQVAILEVGTGGLTVGDTVCSDSVGKGVTSSGTAGKTYYAIALETGVAGDRVRVLVVPGVKTS